MNRKQKRQRRHRNLIKPMAPSPETTSLGFAGSQVPITLGGAWRQQIPALVRRSTPRKQ